MAVTVDRAPLQAEELGLCTVGQVLAHLQRANRLVVHVLMDGREPDLRHIAEFRRSPLKDHTLYIETNNPRDMALEVLDEVQDQLREVDRLKSEAVDFLQKNQNVKAMERLAGCFTTWQNAHQSIRDTTNLLKIDPNAISVAGLSLSGMLDQFAAQLRQIKSALENRDFVTLCDLLIYDTAQTSLQWRQSLEALRIAIG